MSGNINALRESNYYSLQHTGLTHIRKQGGTESGTVVEDSRLVQMLQALTSLTDDERELLAELLKKMGYEVPL